MDVNKRPQEINIADLAISFLLHWRSIIAVIITFAIIGGAVGFVSAYRENESQDSVVVLSEERLSLIKEAEDDYIRINELKEKFSSGNNTLSLAERSEINSNITQAENFLNTKINSLTESEKKKYYFDCGITLDSVDTVAEVSELSVAFEYGVLVAGIGLFIYALFFAIAYVCNNYFKFCDNISEFGLERLGNVIDWNAIDSRKWPDKVLLRWKYGSEKQIEKTEKLEILSKQIIRISKDECWRKIVLISLNTTEEADFIKQNIEANNGFEVINVNDPTISAIALEQTLDSDAVLIVLKANKTRYNELAAQERLIMKHKIKVIGTIVVA